MAQQAQAAAAQYLAPDRFAVVVVGEPSLSNLSEASR